MLHAMPQAQTYRRRLFERALDQYGYVTTDDAEELGVPAVELRKLAYRGGLQHIAYGLYRFDDVPHTPHDQFMEAVLRVGPDAYLTGDAVLALHDLALVNPRRIRVATSRRPRRQLPEFVEVVQRRDVSDRERTAYEGIPSETVAQALLHCRGAVMRDRLLEATQRAASRGLVRRSEATRVLEELGAPA